MEEQLFDYSQLPRHLQEVNHGPVTIAVFAICIAGGFFCMIAEAMRTRNDAEDHQATTQHASEYQPAHANSLWALRTGSSAHPADQHLAQRPSPPSSQDEDLQWALAASVQASISTAFTLSPDEQRRQLVRSCLEFRTISAPVVKNNRTTSTNLAVPNGDGITEATEMDDDDDNSKDKERDSKRKPRRKKKKKSSNSKDNNDDETNCCHRNTKENDGGQEGPRKQKTKRKKRRKKKSSTENNNKDTELSYRSSLIANIMQNNTSITDSIRSMVADILRRDNNPNEDKDYDEEDPSIVPRNTNANNISMNEVLDSMRLGGPNISHTESCSICLEPFAVGDRVARMKRSSDDSRHYSGHWFKEDCILDWLQTHDDCPLSRIRIVYPVEEDPTAAATTQARPMAASAAPRPPPNTTTTPRTRIAGRRTNNFLRQQRAGIHIGGMTFHG